MILNRKALIALLILLSAFLVMGSVSAQDDGDHSFFKASSFLKKLSPTKTVNVKIHNFKPGVLWGPKAVKFANGDAIAGYVEYNGNMQFDRGTGVTCWFLGNGLNGDIEPHHTKLIKAKFYFKNKNGKTKSKTVKGNGGHIRCDLISGYTPYKAKVWYKNY